MGISKKHLNKLLFIILFTVHLPVSAQLGNWLMYFGQNNIHENWSIHTEVQYRSAEVYPKSLQLLLRTGVQYHISDRAIGTLGYGYIVDYDDNEKAVSIENRIFQQFILKNKVGRFYIDHRYRIEQRWINFVSDDNIYTNRARYLLGVSVPLNNKEMSPKTVFVRAYNETFLHIKTPGTFNQNRLYGAIGYQATPAVSFQVGYLNQYTTQGNSFLQFAVFINPTLFKPDFL